MRQHSPPVDHARFRETLSRFATGLTVVSAMDRDQPVGLAVNSFTSVSLDPPLIAFCAAHTSTTWPKVRAAGGFCVNVLSEDQEQVARAFAVSGGDKFQGLGWRPSPGGWPLIEGVLAWIDCRIETMYPAGDHVIVVGRVIELDAEGNRGPMVFFASDYRTLA